MTSPVPSIQGLGDRVGAVAAGHMDTAMRAFLQGGAARFEASYVSLLSGEPHPLGNFALFRDPNDEPGTRAVLEDMRSCSVPTAFLFVNKPTTDVDRLLAEGGYVMVGEMPAMAVEIESMLHTNLPNGYRCDRVSDRVIGEAWTDCFAAGYDLPRGLAELFSPNKQPADDSPAATSQFFAVFRGDQIVATSLLHLADGLAGIYCVATLPAERGKGLGAHVTAEPLRRARSLGYKVGVLQSSHDGHSVYRRLGFQEYGSVPMYLKA